MRSIEVLAATARRLNREAGAPRLPALWFFTDPARTPDPVAVAARLPRGSGVIYRHFGAANREALARQLAKVCRTRGLVLLIAADPGLAVRVGAGGVHWPEHWPGRRAKAGRLTTCAAHSAQALRRAERLGADACFLSAVFPTRSASGSKVWGPRRAVALARRAPCPVMALGGVNATNARLLLGREFAGLAAVEALLGP